MHVFGFFFPVDLYRILSLRESCHWVDRLYCPAERLDVVVLVDLHHVNWSGIAGLNREGRPTSHA